VVGSNQFSMQQILDAGHRAEASGNHDHAHQFYSHILNHHPNEPEAATALEGVRRLEDNGHANPAPASRLTSLGAGLAPGRTAGHGKSATSLHQKPAPHKIFRSHRTGQKAHKKNEFSRRPRAYRFGRFWARLVGGVATLGLIASLTALGANIATAFIRPPGAVLETLATSPGMAAALLVVSAVVLLLSQMAQATFDMAAARVAPHTDAAAE
jgi:hypothetical protein